MLNNWLLTPPEKCVNFLVDEVVYAGLLHRSLTTMAGMSPFLKLARKQLERKRQSTDALKKLLYDYRSLGPMAKEHIDNGFNIVHGHSLVALWSAIESTVEDCVTSIFEMAPEMAESKIKDAGYKVKGNSLTSVDVRARQRAYLSLEGQTRKDRHLGDGYFELFRAVGIDLEISQVTMNTLTEVNAVRNCIVHNGSMIDERAILAAPQLSDRLGESIHIDRELYLRYFDAMKAFAEALLDAATKSDYLPIVQSDT